MAKRRTFTAAFKAKVALETLRGDRTMQKIAAKHQLHPNQVSQWKRQALDGLNALFDDRPSREADHEAEKAELHAKIGKLVVETTLCREGSDDEPCQAARDYPVRP